MSATLLNVRRFIQKALNQKSSKWQDELGRNYKPGQNPWTELFQEETTNTISEIINITDVTRKYELRLCLAAAADEIRSSINFVGGSAAEGRKASWRSKVIKHAEQLQNDLKQSSGLLSAWIDSDRTKRSLHIEPSVVGARFIENVQDSIENLLTYLKKFEDRRRRRESLAREAVKIGKQKPKKTRTEEPGAIVSEHLQYAVDKMAAVFVHCCGVERATRKGGIAEVYGEFPDFIRAATLPVLKAYMSEYTQRKKSSPKLDAQIQKACKNLRGRS